LVGYLKPVGSKRLVASLLSLLAKDSAQLLATIREQSAQRGHRSLGSIYYTTRAASSWQERKGVMRIVSRCSFCQRARYSIRCAVCQCRQPFHSGSTLKACSPTHHIYTYLFRLANYPIYKILSLSRPILLDSRSQESLILPKNGQAGFPMAPTTAFRSIWDHGRKTEQASRTNRMYCKDENTCCYIETSRQPSARTEVKSSRQVGESQVREIQAAVRFASPHNRRKRTTRHDITKDISLQHVSLRLGTGGRIYRTTKPFI
jgi:hypothetical protein